MSNFSSSSSLASSPKSDPPAGVSNSQMIKASIASVLGWSLDLFDLFILLYVAPVVGQVFFPSHVPVLSLAAVYASFAVTLIVRPLGSAIFGAYADKHGRKGAMTVAFIGVGLASASFGLLPTVDQIGITASIIFLVLRIVQGVFVGGVVASTHTIGTESVPAKWRGTMSGLIGGGGAGLGALFASIVYLIVTQLFPGEAFNGWGWRVMFFSGILSSVMGIFVFKSLEESPLWKQLKKEKETKKTAQIQPENEKSPVKIIFTKYRSVFFVNLMIVFGGGAGYYLTSGYLPTLLKMVNKINPTTASFILMGASVVAIITPIALGYLSDQIGRKKTFLIIGVINLIALPLLGLGLGHATSISAIAFYAIVFSGLGNAGYAPVMIFLNERFPTAIRSSGTGISWNTGFALGGIMPTFVSLVSSVTGGIPVALACFLAVIYLIFIIGSIIIPETKGNF
ncbi:MFS transporter [Neobacillus drentensis]|uniref:MFS transporter n=1 Tax=Neobacillus drentensis TaxID=220684 RepID=UPI002FFD7DBB